MSLSMEAPVADQADIQSAPLSEGYRTLLPNRSFMAIWIGQIFSQLADRIVFVVFIAAIVEYFGTREALKSYLYVAFTIPAIMLTAVAGVFVDRWHRQTTLVLTNLLRAAIVLLLPVALAAKHLMGLYWCAFGISMVTQFFVPAEAATIPMIVRPSQLMVANSLFTTTMMASLIFGFTLTDPLLEWLGLEQVHWAIITFYILAAFFVLFVNAGFPSKKAEALQNNGTLTWYESFHSLWDDMREGFTYLKTHPLVLYKMLLLAVLFSSVVAATILFVSFADQVLYANPKVAARKFVWLITFSGLGMVIASGLIGRWARDIRKHRLVYGGFVIIGLGLLSLMVAPVFSTAIKIPVFIWTYSLRVVFSHAVTFLLGVGAAMVAIPLQSVLHLMIPEDKRGKILGIQFTLLSACSTFPVLLAGYGAELFGIMPMLAVGGLPLLILGLWGLYDGMVNSSLGRKGLKEQVIEHYGSTYW